MTQPAKKILELPMPDNLMATYRTLAKLAGFTLLKSDGKRGSPWDIITALPHRSEKIYQVQTLLDLNDARQQSVEPSLGDFPFQGGVVGYLSYEYGRQALGIMPSDNNPYADLPIACLNWHRWCIVVNLLKPQAFLLYATDSQTLSDVDRVLTLWHGKTTPIHPVGFVDWQAVWQKRDYETAFAQIETALKAGRCYQVNLTQPFRLQTEAGAWQLFEHVFHRNPVPYGAYFGFDDYQILSFSPECFVTVDQDKVTTKPIKGSIGRSHDNPDLDKALAMELQNSAKDRAENVMIVDLLRNDLSKIAQKGSVQVEALCELQSFPDIHHLVSVITAIKRQHLNALDVLLSVFPGGSITGAPKIEAMKVIAELEATSRGPYCGSLFYWSDHGRLDSNIAIRTITAVADKYWLHAGGGIVIDSHVDLEYEESLIKLSAILKAIYQR